jgi:glutathione S-transferase
MLRLYTRHEGPGRPPRVRWALEEASAEYEWVVMDEAEGRGEEHRRRHPGGRVPVLETDEGFLFESAALCLHVADLFPEARLIAPPATYDRGLTYQWAFFAMTELEPTVVRRIVAGAEGETACEDELLARAFGTVTDALGGRGHLVGGGFSIADVVVGGVLQTCERYSLLPPAGAIRAYYDELDARPAKQRAYADQPPLPPSAPAEVSARWNALRTGPRRPSG